MVLINKKILLIVFVFILRISLFYEYFLNIEIKYISLLQAGNSRKGILIKGKSKFKSKNKKVKFADELDFKETSTIHKEQESLDHLANKVKKLTIKLTRKQTRYSPYRKNIKNEQLKHSSIKNNNANIELMGMLSNIRSQELNHINKEKYLNLRFSKYVPSSLLNKCETVYQELLETIDKLNNLFYILKSTSKILSKYGGNKHNSNFQTNIKNYNSNKNQYDQLNLLFTQNLSFLLQKCMTNKSNIYETQTHLNQLREKVYLLKSLMPEYLIKAKDELLFKCKTEKLVQKLINKRKKCHKCKKKLTPCRRHYRILQELKDIQLQEAENKFLLNSLKIRIQEDLNILPLSTVLSLKEFANKESQNINSTEEMQECIRFLNSKRE